MRLRDHVYFHHSPLVPRLGEPGLMNPNSVNEPQKTARGITRAGCTVFRPAVLRAAPGLCAPMSSE